MGAFEHFPYTNFHDLNLDWIVDKIRDWEQSVRDFEAKFADIETDWTSIEKEWGNITSQWGVINEEWRIQKKRIDTAINNIGAEIDEKTSDFENEWGYPVAVTNALSDSDIINIVESTPSDYNTLGGYAVFVNGVASSALANIGYFACSKGRTYHFTSDKTYKNPHANSAISIAIANSVPSAGATYTTAILYGKSSKELVDFYYTATQSGYIWITNQINPIQNLGTITGKIADFTANLQGSFRQVLNETTTNASTALEFFSPNTGNAPTPYNVEREAYVYFYNPATLSYDTDLVSIDVRFQYTASLPAKINAGMFHFIRMGDSDVWMCEYTAKATETSADFRTGTVFFKCEQLTEMRLNTNPSTYPLIPAGTRIISMAR